MAHVSPKNDLRIHALGDVDELNACIGVLRSQITHSNIQDKNTWDKSLSLIPALAIRFRR